jgi:uncharacterized protein DUF4331/flagellar hook capping protein FlgD
VLHRSIDIAALLAMIVALTGLFLPEAFASSHSEAPGTAKDRLADDTDLYAFVSRDAPDAVTFVGLWIPLLEPNGGPNFYTFDDDAFYYFNIDNAGDCVDHLRYQFKFTSTRQTGNTFLYNTGQVTSLDDPDLNVRQNYQITRIVDGIETVIATDLPVAPNYVGPASMPNYSALAKAAVQTLPNGIKVFAGPRDDPFFVDLAAIFDLLTIRKPPGNQGEGVDGVAGFDVMAIVMQIPFTLLTRDGRAPTAETSVIGIYDSVERFKTRVINGDGTVTSSGPEVQVSRLGMPLVNEVVIPLKDKDKFNASAPAQDGQFLNYVTNPELPVLLNLLYGIRVPPTPRNDLVTVFLKGVPGLNQPANQTAACEMLRLNMLVPPAREAKRLAVLRGDTAGFPNGRRLTDDVVDIEERVAAGVLIPGFDIKPNRQLGDGVDVNDRPFLPYFPYVALPHNPFRHSHDGTEQDKALLDMESIDHEATPVASPRDEEDEDGDSSTIAPSLGPGAAAPAETPSTARGALRFSVPAAGHVTLKLYDVRGRMVRSLVDQDAAPGDFEARWDGRDDTGARSSRGIYFARFMIDGKVVEHRKVMLAH